MSNVVTVRNLELRGRIKNRKEMMTTTWKDERIVTHPLLYLRLTLVQYTTIHRQSSMIYTSGLL